MGDLEGHCINSPHREVCPRPIEPVVIGPFTLYLWCCRWQYTSVQSCLYLGAIDFYVCNYSFHVKLKLNHSLSKHLSE